MTATLRFAPSPTGHLHIGNLRAALINWLLATKLGGQFILRIDDTDSARSRPEYEAAIKGDLRRLGLDWDREEHQSARWARYEAAISHLKQTGRLYPCYETPEELALKRKAALARGQPPIYDRAALTLDETERARLEAEGRHPHWRFKLEHAPIDWVDLVQGELHFEGANLSDPVVIRADGTPLYTLPSCVDDVDFSVTHVVRGEDHISNTATQIQIFEALGGAPPSFAHLPLLTDSGGGKLSKRLGSRGVTALLDEEGLEPMAVLSMLAKLGSGQAIEPRTGLDQLAAEFDITALSRSGAKFDMDTLYRVNERLLHITPHEQVADRLRELVDEPVDAAFWETVRANVTRLAEAAEWWRLTKQPIEPAIEDPDFTAKAAALLPEGELDRNSWQAWTRALRAETGRKGKQLFLPLRRALTGRDHGPELADLLPLIGHDRALKRLRGERA